jgi:DNA-binding NarL/FixJ family response regulator
MALGSTPPVAVIADDHIRVLDKVAEILSGLVTVVAKVYDGAAAVRATTKHKPDVVVLDVLMPHLSGIGAAREIRRLGLDTKIIFLSIQEDPEFLGPAREIGASYVFKKKMNTDLVMAVRSELSGTHFFSSP